MQIVSKVLHHATYNSCFIKEHELVWIENADFSFKLLPQILTSLKGNPLYLRKKEMCLKQTEFLPLVKILFRTDGATFHNILQYYMTGSEHRNINISRMLSNYWPFLCFGTVNSSRRIKRLGPVVQKQVSLTLG